jgi:DNA segregation ATPase FtsK/SpoIIIE-like protein
MENIVLLVVILSVFINVFVLYKVTKLERHLAAQTEVVGTRTEDYLYEQAKEVVSQAGKASASLLQRRLKIGYARAARLLDILEEEGIIGEGKGAAPRKVIVK